jgi:uncharacterized small protein (DUF1192 family)
MENMEYLFFDKDLAERFMAACAEHANHCRIEIEQTPSDGDAYSVVLESLMSDEAAERVEALYDDFFFGEQAAQIEGNGAEGALADACGVQVKLSSGEYTTVAIEPEIMNKILSVLSIDELQQFLAQVAEDIENPKSGPICRRKREEEALMNAES